MKIGRKQSLKEVRDRRKPEDKQEIRTEKKAKGQKNGRDKQKPQKLQKKLFRYFLILPVAILAFFAVFFYQYVSQILISREKTSLASLNEALMQDVERGVSDLYGISADINYYNIKTGFLRDEEDLSLYDNPSLTETIITLNGTDVRADQINIYAMSGYGVEIGTITKNITIDPDEEAWFGEATALRGEKIIGRPYLSKRYSLSGRKADWYLSIYRAAINRDGKCVGTIETVRRCRMLFKSLNNARSSTDAPVTCVFDQDGHMIYPYTEDDELADACRTYISRFRENGEKSGEFRMPDTGEKCTFTSQQARATGWTYLTIQKDAIILRPLYLFIELLAIMVAAALVATILLSRRLARSMILPIKHLKHIIQRMSLSTLGQEKPTDYETVYEELYELYAEFEKMNSSLQKSLRELEESRQLETRARAYALQAQMNPHFYYNTLSCISILAEDGMTDEVQQMCHSLSDIMRYITDSRETIVPMEKEIDYIRRYMYCMKIRYQSSLDYEISIDESLYEEKIPKLVLQPIVENAVKYGTDCIPPWKITICGQRLEDGWVIEARDTGNGFPDDKLAEIRSRIAAAEASGSGEAPDLHIGGLGIVNVYLRWSMYCKGTARFEIGNTEDGHHAYVRIGRTGQVPSEQPASEQV